jgi:hypothetical protein
MAMKSLPSQKFLHQCFDYDQHTGILTWKVRPRVHFLTAQAWKVWNCRFAGKAAGCIIHGYVSVVLTYRNQRSPIGAHRICWALVTGAWPKDEIDHRNGVRADNRLENLREATVAENAQNNKAHVDSTTGFLGIHWHKKQQKWRATIRVGQHRHHLGLFSTPEAAHAAYIKAKARLHSFQPILRGRFQ